MQIKSPSFTDEQLAKLRSYLENEADNLAKNNSISYIAHYPKKEKLRDYKWLVINIKGLGMVEMYFTGVSSTLKINGIYVEGHRVESFNFREIHDLLRDVYNQKLINNSEEFFNKL